MHIADKNTFYIHNNRIDADNNHMTRTQMRVLIINNCIMQMQIRILHQHFHHKIVTRN